MQKATEDLEILNQTISSQEDFLESRLVALYKFGDEGVPQVLFSSHSYGDFLNSRLYLALIVGQDRQLIEDFHKREAYVEKYREELKENRARTPATEENDGAKKGRRFRRTGPRRAGCSMPFAMRNSPTWRR